MSTTDAARSPCEGTSGFENHFEVRVAASELADCFYKVFGVVSLPCHKVAAAHIYPFKRGYEVAEAGFECREYLFEVVARRFAQGVEMQPLDTFGQAVGRHSETRAGKRRIVYLGFDNRAFWIDPQPGTYSGFCRFVAETFVLA